jgi:hypothetical protein
MNVFSVLAMTANRHSGRVKDQPSPLAVGNLTLADLAESMDVLTMVCRCCDLAKRDRLHALIERYGPGMIVGNLLCLLSVGCPMRESVSPNAVCGIYCVDFR